MDLTYEAEQIGEGAEALEQLAEGRHPFCQVLAQAENPVIIVGTGLLSRPDAPELMPTISQLVRLSGVYRPDEDWNGFNVLQTASSRVAGLDLGLTAPKSAAPAKAVYLVGADDLAQEIPRDAFVVYQGHHGDQGATRADVVLPSTAYTEKDSAYSNTEGRTQYTKTAVVAPGEARDDWKVLRALSEVMGKPLPYDTLYEVRERIMEIAPSMGTVGDVVPPTVSDPFAMGVDLSGSAAVGATEASDEFSTTVSNFYMTDPISRSSQTMAKCTEQYPTAVSTRPPSEERIALSAA